MSDPLSNASAFIDAVQKITDAGQVESHVAGPEEQASAITDVIANLGIQEASVFQQVADLITNSGGSTPPAAPGAPRSWTFTVNGQQITISLPPPVGETLPKPGTPDLEELFGAKASDPVDRFFINIAATVASVFSTFFGLGSIRSRNVLQQFQATMPDVVMGVPDLADGVERNVLEFEDAAEEATASGVDRTRFQNYVDLAGEPPGPTQAIELLRRKLIESDRFAQMIAYSRIKTEYIPDLMQLAYETMSGADAVDGYVKGVPVTPADFTAANLTPPNLIPPAAPVDPTPDEENTYQTALRAYNEAMTNEYFREMFSRAGGLDSQWDILKNAAGDSLGVVKAVSLYHHHKIKAAELFQILGRSRINPIFYPQALLYNDKWFSAYQIGEIVAANPALVPQASNWLTEDGYPTDQITPFLAAKAGGSVKKAKNETEAQVLEVYEAGTKDATWATTQLKNLGYTPAAIALILQAADNKRKLAYLNAAITRIRSRYISWHIKRDETVTDLQALGISAAVAKEYIDLWTVERDSEKPTISPTIVGSLLKKGRIQPPEALAKWEQQGYSPEDAKYLCWEYEPTPASLKSNVPAP